MPRIVTLAGTLGLALILQSGPAAAQTGALSQLAGLDGCVVDETSTPIVDCADGRALREAVGVAASPDGKNVYVASLSSDAVAVFGRNRRTGKLRQLAGLDGCVSETGSGGDCADGRALNGAVGIAVSLDGRNVYVAAFGGGVAVFGRDRRTGALSQLAGLDGCVSEDGSGGDCADGRGLASTRSVTVSPDGRNVYATATATHSVAVFSRDRRTGALSQLAGLDGCIVNDTSPPFDCAVSLGRALRGAYDVAVSPDGRNVYFVSQSSAAVAVFGRDRETGALSQLAGLDGCIVNETSTPIVDCADGRALQTPQSVTVSPDGRNVYVASLSSDAVAVFGRDRKTGKLRQLGGRDGCISEDGTSGACADGRSLSSASDVAVSRDGRNVYVAASGVAVFGRDRRTGKLRQLAGRDGCITEDGTSGDCADGRALIGTGGVAVSPDGKNVYVASQGSAAVAVLDRRRW